MPSDVAGAVAEAEVDEDPLCHPSTLPAFQSWENWDSVAERREL
jgi:hypothetical protein